MLLCNRCGQCKLIEDINFSGFRNISGTEYVYIDNEDAGNIVDYGDSNTDSDGDLTVVCPHCDSEDIETDWEGTLEEAEALRNTHVARLLERSKQREQERIKSSSWDN